MKVDQEHARIVGRPRRKHGESDYFVRALSHDMSANFMLLENSFSRLKRALSQPSRCELDEAVLHVEACLRQSKRFLDDLVDLARTGSVQMEPSRVELAEVVDEVLFEHRQLIADGSVQVDVRRPLQAVWCNRHRLKQVITNLLRNAVKHGCDPKHPRVSISSGPGEEDTAERGREGFVSIRIHDNGPGIDPEFHDQVFLPGQRLAGASGDGSGMGLAIVKKIVEYYGGRVYVNSGVGTGTAFVVCLPSAEDGPTDHRSRPRSTAGAERQARGLSRDVPDDHRHHPHRLLSRRSGPYGGP